MSQQTDFLSQEHDRRDPSPWLALYLDQSVTMDPHAKRAWLEDVSSRNRQFVLPLTRPFARTMIAVFQVLKTFAPHVASSKLLHQLLARGMKTFMTPNANLLVMRHFHLGSEILRFIGDNSGVQVPSNPLKPLRIDDLKDELFLKHDMNLFNFVIDLNRKLLAEGKELGVQRVLDFSAISEAAPPFESFPDGLLNFVDLESAIELYTPLYQLLLTDRDFWRSSNSLQLDETIALYIARVLGTSTHVALANNKHPMVPMTTLRAGYRLVLHGLSTELLHALLVKAKREQHHSG